MKYFPFLILVVYLTKSFFIAPGLFDFGVISLMAGLFFAELRYKYLAELKSQEVGEKAKELEDLIQKQLKESENVFEKRLRVYEDKINGINLVMAKNNINQTSINDRPKTAWF